MELSSIAATDFPDLDSQQLIHHYTHVNVIDQWPVLTKQPKGGFSRWSEMPNKVTNSPGGAIY